MSAYFIVDQQGVSDPETMKTYSAGVAGTVKQYGGIFVVRGGDPETIEGDWPAKRIIMIEFADRAALMAWYDSPEYADLKAMRLASSSANVIAVDGA
ncbi:MAG: DUF1330 domain-containing protein [Proteobacteria bacterium]|nr:DUF1330 domain-containing protein [Pseudomonadota bacterium]MDA1325258.1 DUF1330 domain-containing protein [Pseudomonadota bacterium]